MNQTKCDTFSPLNSTTITICHIFQSLFLDTPIFEQGFAKRFANRGVRSNLLVHHRLGFHGLFALVMSSPSITNELDDYILVKSHPVIRGKLRNEDYSLRIISVDMKNWGLNHFRDFSAILRRAGVFLTICSEANLIVDDDMNRPACFKSDSLRHLKRLHHNTLAREGGVSVNHDRADQIPCFITPAILSCSHGTLYDWAHNL